MPSKNKKEYDKKYRKFRWENDPLYKLNSKKRFRKHWTKPWVRTLSHLKSRCKRSDKFYYNKEVEMSLTLNELKELWFRDKAFLMKKPSIDRKNPLKGYHFDNCRYMEMRENIQRHHKIIRHLIKKYPNIFIECALEI